MKLGLLLALFPLLPFAQGRFDLVELPKPEGNTYKFAQSEPSIAIDPKCPKKMVAGSILDNYYYSKNGGKTWKSKMIESTYGVYGDPVLIYDTKGRIYFFHLASYTKATHLDRILCQSTPKINKSFNDGTFPKPNGTKVQDKHWIVVDQETNDLYMTWTQFDAYNSDDEKDSSIIVFSKSKDQGLTWSDPMRISHYAGDCLDSDGTVEGAVPAMSANGDIIVTWTGPQGLVMQRSIDKGESWMPIEKILEPQFGGWDLKVEGMYRANGLPILKSDISGGENHGTLYLNWADQREGEENTDIWLMKSDDNGENWSKPIRVNQDDSKRHQFFTWMEVDQSNGNLYFVYYDRRNTKSTETDVFMSYSTDGGDSFTDELISKSSFTPDSTFFFGDYLNIAAVDGTIRPIWPSFEEGKVRLWVALIDEKQLVRKED